MSLGWREKKARDLAESSGDEAKEERERVVAHIRELAKESRERSAFIRLNCGKGNEDHAKRSLHRAEVLGALANEIESGKHLLR